MRYNLADSSTPPPIGGSSLVDVGLDVERILVVDVDVEVEVVVSGLVHELDDDDWPGGRGNEVEELEVVVVVVLVDHLPRKNTPIRTSRMTTSVHSNCRLCGKKGLKASPFANVDMRMAITFFNDCLQTGVLCELLRCRSSLMLFLKASS